jgi:hypothetical protein
MVSKAGFSFVPAGLALAGLAFAVVVELQNEK